MALVKYGGGIIQMSGSIAGNTHARNATSNYIRARTKPINPNTPGQQRVRTVLAELTERWYTTLSVLQRTNWGVYAKDTAMTNKLGETIYLSGFNHYIRSNSIRLQMAKTLIDEAPAAHTVANQDTTVYVRFGETSDKFVVYFNTNLPWVTENNAHMFVQQGLPQNPTRNFFAGPWYELSQIDGIAEDGPTSPQSLPLHWRVFEGQKMWGQFRISRADGRLSQPWIADYVASL